MLKLLFSLNCSDCNTLFYSRCHPICSWWSPHDWRRVSFGTLWVCWAPLQLQLQCFSPYRLNRNISCIMTFTFSLPSMQPDCVTLMHSFKRDYYYHHPVALFKLFTSHRVVTVQRLGWLICTSCTICTAVESKNRLNPLKQQESSVRNFSFYRKRFGCMMSLNKDSSEVTDCS